MGDSSVRLGVPSVEGIGLRDVDTVLSRVKSEGLDRSILELVDDRWSGRNLVEVPVAGNHPCMDRSSRSEHLSHLFAESSVGNSDDLAGDASGVGERTESVEDGGDAELGSHRANVTHGRVICAGKREPDPGFSDYFFEPFGCHIEVDAERFKQVEAARGGRSLAVAVLADDRTCACGDEARHRRHVERCLAAARRTAHADDIDGFGRNVQRRGRLTHRPHHAAELRHSFALLAQRSDVARDLCVGRATLQDVVEHRFRVFTGYVVTRGQRPKRRGPATEIIKRRHEPNASSLCYSRLSWSARFISVGVRCGPAIDPTIDAASDSGIPAAVTMSGFWLPPRSTSVASSPLNGRFATPMTGNRSSVAARRWRPRPALPR